MRINSEIDNPNVPCVQITSESQLLRAPDQKQVVQIEQTRVYQPNQSKRLWVISNLTARSDGGHVLLVKDETSDGEQIWIADHLPHYVPLTEKVCEQLQKGNLIEISAERAAEIESEHIADSKAEVEARREVAKAKYVAAFGHSNGFDAAYESILQTETLAGLLH